MEDAPPKPTFTNCSVFPSRFTAQARTRRAKDMKKARLTNWPANMPINLSEREDEIWGVFTMIQTGLRHVFCG